MGRRLFWFYRYGSWTPRWWNYVVPYCGSDEYGRHTLVIHLPPVGFLVWAYRTCRCADCDEQREQTARWEAEEAAERALADQGAPE